MDSQPVWISSVDHLKRYTKIVRDTPVYKRLSGKYDIPENFPQMVTPSSMVPIVYFSNGLLSLQHEKALFAAEGQKTSITINNAKFLNTAADLRFEITYDSLISIELYRYPDSLGKNFDIDWIRILSNNKTLNGDFLICAGKQNVPPEDIISETHKLYKRLIDLTIDTIK